MILIIPDLRVVGLLSPFVVGIHSCNQRGCRCKSVVFVDIPIAPASCFGENCGASLTGKAAVGATKSFEEESSTAGNREQITAAGSDYFLPGSVLRIEIEGGPEPIRVKPEQELVFGRRDPATGGHARYRSDTLRRVSDGG